MTSSPEWIMQVPVISTIHISKETTELLRFNDGHPWNQEVVYIDGGWLLYVGANEATDLPEDLSRLFTWTVGLGYEWLRLDQDGDIIDDLPEHVW